MTLKSVCFVSVSNADKLYYFINSKKSTGLTDLNGKDITFDEINIGYSGVISPDGRVGFRLTCDDKLLKDRTGKKLNEILRTLKDNFKSSSFPSIDKFNLRNGSHATLQDIGFKEEKNLWGFAINKRADGKIEIGFSSGQVNARSNNGRMPWNGSTNPADERNMTILNRSHQKKVIEYLENYLGTKIELKNTEMRPNSSGILVEFHYY